HIDQLFLKQFPDTSGVKAVYQAVVSAPATIDKVHSARLLGYTYQFTLNKFDSFRLDDTLGFQIGTQPVLLPFHISMDFTVHEGEALAEFCACEGEAHAEAEPAEAEPAEAEPAEAEPAAPAPEVAATIGPGGMAGLALIADTAAADPAPDPAAPAAPRAPKGRPEKIAILGGGPGAMAAAYYLTDDPGWRDRYEITVYQMGWRLGGKCASGRNADMGQRIEEHGLHLWFGFYNNGFDLMRKAYSALDRAPGMPLATLEDAFKPHNLIVVTELIKDEYKFWPLLLPIKPGVPGGHHGELTFAGIAATLTAWIHQWIEHLNLHLIEVVHNNFKEGVHHIESIADGVMGFFRRLKDSFHLWTPGSRDMVIDELQALRASVFDTVHDYLDEDDPTRHLFICIDLAVTALIGMHADHVMFRNFDVINDIDFRDWLLKHGANPDYSVDSALVRALYDLTFAYEDGDTQRPNIEAGTMLRGLLRLTIDYHGSFIWKMQAGMGDTVFTPLYKVLKQRGVDFKFFQKVDELIPAPDSDEVMEIVITEQMALAAGQKEYDPLVEVARLDCWPDRPKYELLDPAQGQMLKDSGADLESYFDDWPTIHSAAAHAELPVTRLQRGVDFDTIVCGLPVGALSYVCPKLLERSPALKDASVKVETTATQAYQMWLSEKLENPGWNHVGAEEEDPVLSSFSEPFDTLTPMNQLLKCETWPEECTPQSVAYFCSPIQTPAFTPATRANVITTVTLQVKNHAIEQLTRQASNFWPGAVVDGAFRWDVLISPSNERGALRFDSQYWRANVNPPELYVQSVVGSTAYRITSDGSGFRNLFFAGDWLKTGLNAGCVEAAIMGGMQASRAISGHPAVIRGETDR
ncbi:NAD(P)-binding protein, partial [Caballeronia sp. BR00000012568055]|uniref:NAD(P)-binding protein n=1 Tax=Caballeronia sp. BR00000012568055 TaxID=2918761 RepID=UPI0023F88321